MHIKQLNGMKGLEQEDFPDTDERIPNDMGFFVHDGGQTTLPIDYEIMADFMHQHFSSPTIHKALKIGIPKRK